MCGPDGHCVCYGSARMLPRNRHFGHTQKNEAATIRATDWTRLGATMLEICRCMACVGHRYADHDGLGLPGAGTHRLMCLTAAPGAHTTSEFCQRRAGARVMPPQFP